MIRFPISAPLLTELLAWRRGDRERMRISGPSMEPTLHPGEHVLVDPDRAPNPGDLVTARPEAAGRTRVVKRLDHRTPDGGVWLTSDNRSAGTASETWGALPAVAVDGVVTVNLSRGVMLVDQHGARNRRWGWLLR